MGRSFRYVKWGGTALTLLSLAFLVRRALHIKGTLAEAWPTGAWVGLLAGAVVCAGGGVALVLAWTLLLRRHGGQSLPFAHAFRVYASTQVAKYIPGNVFQYAGRHVEGWQAGIPHHALALSAVGEAVGLALVAVALALAGLAATGDSALLTGLAGAAACLFAYPYAQRGLRWAGRRWWREIEALALGGTRREDVGALLAHLLFFVAVGFAFYLSAKPWGAGEMPHLGTLVAACSLAWLAGFATPGAPAGLGVREVVLVFALEESLGKEGALGAAALFRGATTLGDLLLYGASKLFR